MSKKMPKKVAKKAKKLVKKLVKKAAAKKIVAKKHVKSAAKALKKAKQVAVKAVKKPVEKPAQQKKAVVQKPMARPVAEKPVAVSAKAAPVKASYKVNDYVVYPTHGVGKIVAEETQKIGDVELRMLVINFEKDKMTLRVPMHRAAAAGLRPVCSGEHMKKVFLTLKSKAKISRGMWSRRAQEYETKINSGNIILVAEVVRDLHQNVDQSERSYSERMIYENALARLVGELAAIEGTDQKTAYDKIMKLLRAKVAAANILAEAAKAAA